MNIEIESNGEYWTSIERTTNLGYYINSWHKNKYTYTEVKELAKDLGTTNYCVDCVNCVDCKECYNCTDCGDCKKCISCVDCADCKSCTKCNYCDKCKICKNCYNLDSKQKN